MMKNYTIYCTEEQVNKAAKLGAPIESESEYQFLANQEHGYYRGGTFQGLIECMGENIAIFGNEPNRVACIIPTAEQMIGWLEEVSRIHITIERQFHGIEDVQKYRIWVKEDSKPSSPIIKMYTYNSRKEATLAAISAALEYLENNEKIKSKNSTV